MNANINSMCAAFYTTYRNFSLMVALGFWGFTITACAPEASVASRIRAPKTGDAYIEAHMHIHPHYRSSGVIRWDVDAAVEVALASMDRFGVTAAVIMPPPFPPGRDNLYDYEQLVRVVRVHPDRFAFLGGGGLLNPLIQKARNQAKVGPNQRRVFREKAMAILRAGAKGFGELTALHLSFRPRHPFEEVRPDHPLFRLLADLAARENVLIDLHMEAVTRRMETPWPFSMSGSSNPPWLQENISAFERLLAHNRSVRIIWTHAGWDNTGHRNVGLMRRLLGTHPNLYMSIKIRTRGRGSRTGPLDRRGNVRPEWMALLREFSDCFLMGSDGHHFVPGVGRSRPALGGGKHFFDQLPQALARRIGYENAVRLFKLK